MDEQASVLLTSTEKIGHRRISNAASSLPLNLMIKMQCFDALSARLAG
jgi:hypothetical protein